MLERVGIDEGRHMEEDVDRVRNRWVLTKELGLLEDVS